MLSLENIIIRKKYILTFEYDYLYVWGSFFFSPQNISDAIYLGAADFLDMQSECILCL